MRKKIKTKNSKNIYIILFIGTIIFYSYLKIVKTSNIKTIIINETNKMFNTSLSKYKSFDKTKMVYESLNKIIDYSDLDIEISLEELPEIPIINQKEEKKDPIVYIYNSHQTESYNEPVITDYTITPTVLTASYILKEHLGNNNIPSMVETNSMKKYLTENGLQYKDSYEASRYYAKNALNENKNVEYLIDLHRDSVKKEKTLYEKKGKKYARIMFVVGTNHKNYEKNLKFVKEINELLNKKYKGISRGIYIREDARFNQDLKDKAILIELGGVDNTLEEINNSLEVFASIINNYMENQNGN